MCKKPQLMCLLLLLLFIFPGVQAEETAVYQDQVYSFRYPAKWTLGKADNGDIVLGPAQGSDAAITFAIRMDLPLFTGDPAADGQAAANYIDGYGGKNLALDGSYDLIESNGLHGFRAYGSWRATGQDAIMVVVSGRQHLVGFVMVGGQSMTLTDMEQMFLSSLVLFDNGPSQGADGFKRWQGEQFSIEYPEAYNLMELSGGAVFVDPADPSNIIMARAYSLDLQYQDSFAPVIAANALPKSAGVEPNAEMISIGGRIAAVIKGTVSDGPMEFYAFGSGKTAIAVMLTGEGACGLAERLIRSAEISQDK